MEDDQTLPESNVINPRRSPRGTTPKTSPATKKPKVASAAAEAAAVQSTEDAENVESLSMANDGKNILNTLRSFNPIATRISAAIQLALKCLTPAFVEHIRTHDIAKKKFSLCVMPHKAKA